MISEAQRFWDAIAGKVRQVAQEISRNALRCERYEVTTAPNGSRMGVTLPMGEKEIFLPYSREVEDATVGSQVLVVWWGSMSNAKVYYYANGYRGASGVLATMPIGYIYISTSSTDPGTIFGGTWTRIQDTFLLAAGTTYTAGATGGEATHTLSVDEIPSHTHTYWDSPRTYDERDTSQNAIICVNDHESSNGINYSVDYTGGGLEHNNMPPYLTVYMWERIA